MHLLIARQAVRSATPRRRLYSRAGRRPQDQAQAALRTALQARPLLLLPSTSRHDRPRDERLAATAQLRQGAAPTHAFRGHDASRRAHAFKRKAFAAVGKAGARIRPDGGVKCRTAAEARCTNGSSAVTGSRPGRSQIAKGYPVSVYVSGVEPRLARRACPAQVPDSVLTVDRQADANAILDDPAPATDLDRLDQRPERTSELLIVD